MFVSEITGSRFEWSAHDDTIKELLPEDVWLPLYLHSGKNLKIETIDDSLIYLVGFGTDSDDAGRMALYRYTADREELAKEESPALKHMATCMAAIEMMLAPHGFRIEKSLWDSIRQN